MPKQKTTFNQIYFKFLYNALNKVWGIWAIVGFYHCNLKSDPNCIRNSALPDGKSHADTCYEQRGKNNRKHSTRSFATSLSEAMPLPTICPASSTFKREKMNCNVDCTNERGSSHLQPKSQSHVAAATTPRFMFSKNRTTPGTIKI